MKVFLYLLFLQMLFFIYSLIGITTLLLSVLAYTDIKRRTLSNQLVLAVLFAVVPLSYLIYQQCFWASSLVTLVIGFILFMLKIIGAGDVKLLSALMIMVPASNVFLLLLLISSWGLLVIIFGLLFYRQSLRQQGVPYGVAIGLGFISYLYFLL